MAGFSAAAVSAAAIFSCAIPDAKAGPALLYEAPSGRVLYAEDADHPWYPASLTKMMTAYVVFEQWKAGRIDRQARVIMSPNAVKQPKMRLGLKAGKDISWDEAVTALIMKSANDVATAIAESASGSEAAFVDRMNATAGKLGMSGSRFINPHGLPGEGQHTTARDMAILSEALARDFPEHMHIFGMREANIGLKRIATHNPVFERVPGGDGMKTGFTCSAGYNVVASATRDGRRLVAVVLGEKTKADRAKRMTALLEFGFETAQWQVRLPSASIATLPATFNDRSLVRTANLDQRLKDCTGPDEETEELIAAAQPPSGAAQVQLIAAPQPSADEAPQPVAPAMVTAPKPAIANPIVTPDPVEVAAAFTREVPDVPAVPQATTSGVPRAVAITGSPVQPSASSQITQARPPSAALQQQKKRQMVRRAVPASRDSSFSFAWP